jgi:hypothetical protein
MAENKTKATEVDPQEFIRNLDSEESRRDSDELVRLMSKVTGKPPRMWGPTIIGFGTYYYKYESGREGEMCMTGFSPRKPSLVLYLGSVLEDRKLMDGLGKHKTGKGCLYIKRLADVDLAVLENLIAKSVAEMRKRYECD